MQAMEPEDMEVAAYATPLEMHNSSPTIQEGIAVLSQIFITKFALPHAKAFAHRAEACGFLRNDCATTGTTPHHTVHATRPPMEWADLPNEFNPIETAWLKIREWNPEAVKPSAITYLADVFPQLRHASAPIETPQRSKKKVATPMPTWADCFSLCSHSPTPVDMPLVEKPRNEAATRLSQAQAHATAAAQFSEHLDGLAAQAVQAAIKAGAEAAHWAAVAEDFAIVLSQIEDMDSVSSPSSPSSSSTITTRNSGVLATATSSPPPHIYSPTSQTHHTSDEALEPQTASIMAMRELDPRVHAIIHGIAHNVRRDRWASILVSEFSLSREDSELFSKAMEDDFEVRHIRDVASYVTGSWDIFVMLK